MPRWVESATRHERDAAIWDEDPGVNVPSEQPTLVLNPPDDDEFSSLAQELVSDGHHSVADFQNRLRSHFPTAIVRRRELVGEPTDTWYVYRDGHWVHPGTPFRARQRGEGSARA